MAIGEKMGRGFNVDELMPALDRLIDATGVTTPRRRNIR